MHTISSRVRSLFFWIHLCIGVAASALILLMSVTGVLLGFERQSIAAIDGTATVAPSPDLPRLSVDSLLSLHAITRADVASVVVRAEVDRPTTIRFRERGRAALLVDPWRGSTVDAPPPGKGQAFFSALRRWHRWVGATSTEWRTRFRAATGAANLAFLFLVLSGLYLWWPTKWTKQRLIATTLPRLTASGKARDFNWHHSFGFLAAVPLALVVASGVFISYQWPGRLLDRYLGSPEERAAAPSPLPALRTVDAALDAALDASIAHAITAHPEWRQLTLTLPSERDTVLRIAVAEGNTYRPDQRYTLSYARATGALLSTSGYGDLSLSRRIRAWVRFGHTGEVFGVTGQLIATLVTAVGALLVWTGLALTWRRWRQWRGRRRVLSSPA
jgi:uncharacterized iron-regulated membrane protein